MKRIISLLLIIAMLFSVGMVTMAAETTITSTAAPAVVGAEELDFLSKLGIMEAGADPAAELSRGEMAKIVMLCLGQSKNIAPVNTSFTDVDASNPFSGYIQLTNGAGIMVGNGDGTFNPNGSVTYNQTVKLLVHAVGHEAYATASGGWPAGYLVAANANGITEGTTPAGDTAISRGVAAILVRNALDVEIMEKVSYGSTYKYESREGVTILTKYFDVYKYTGVVTANYYTTLTGDSTLKVDEIMLDDAKVFETGATDVANYLGYSMDVYAQTIDTQDEPIIVAAYPHSTAVTEVNADDILGKTNEKEFFYTNEADEEESVVIDADVDVLYNGTPIFWNADDLKIDGTGSVKLIDNDGDEDADVIVVYEYKNVIVNSVNEKAKTVTTSKAAYPYDTITIDTENKVTRPIFVDAAGKAITVADCKKGEILSVAMNKKDVVKKVVKSDATVKGTITAIGENEIFLGEVSYPLSKDLTQNTELTQPKLDREATFFMAFDGKIAAVDYTTSTANVKYGYLRGAGKSATSAFGKMAEIKVLTSEGKTEFITLADEVKFDGVRTDNDMVVTYKEGRRNIVDSVGAVVEQMISYVLNAEGKVSELSTAADGSTLSEEEKEEQFSFDKEVVGNGATDFRAYGSSWPIISSKYIVADTTRFFMIPADKKDDNYMVFKFTELPSSGLSFDKVLLYDIDEDNRIGAVVFPKYTWASNYDVGIIKSAKIGVNEEGDKVFKISLYNQYAYNEDYELELTDTITTKNAILKETDPLYGTSTATVDQIKPGDIISYVTLPNEKMYSKELLFRGGNPLDMERDMNGQGKITLEDCYAQKYIGYATIDKITSDAIFYNTTVSGKVAQRAIKLNTSATRTGSYNVKTKTFEEISASSIAEGDKIFIYRDNYYVRLVIVIKE